jgi:hypothetical protein
MTEAVATILASNIDKYHDPFFDLNAVELFLGIIVLCVLCALASWAWRTFKP